MRKLQILVVDDDRDFSESLADILELQGYEVQIAYSGEDAVRKLKEYNFDITFMDMNLPGKNGVESFLEIRKFNPNARVVIMTAYSANRLLDEVVENGAWGVIHKPFDIGHVLEMLGKINPMASL
jgi:two-component system, NtrC family, response regulator HydG